MGITKKQKAVYDYICNYTHANGHAPTQKEIKDQFGLKSFGSVQRYIKYLEDAGYLNTDWNARRGLTVLKPKVTSPLIESFEIPLLGDIAAGDPILSLDQPDETVTVPPHFLKTTNKHFALRVIGDSMIEDGILSGDIAICRHQLNANQGQTVVAVIENEATLKKFFKMKDSIELHPANSRYSPIIVGQDCIDFKIMGILVGLLRSYDH